MLHQPQPFSSSWTHNVNTLFNNFEITATKNEWGRIWEI